MSVISEVEVMLEFQRAAQRCRDGQVPERPFSVTARPAVGVNVSGATTVEVDSLTVVLHDVFCCDLVATVVDYSKPVGWEFQIFGWTDRYLITGAVGEWIGGHHRRLAVQSAGSSRFLLRDVRNLVELIAKRDLASATHRLLSEGQISASDLDGLAPREHAESVHRHQTDRIARSVTQALIAEAGLR